MSELASHPETPTKNDGVKTIPQWIWWLLLIFILGLLYLSWPKKSTQSTKEPEKKESSGGQKKSVEDLDFTEVLDHVDTLHVTDQYKKKVDIGPGEFLSFDATEDYCAKDGNGKEYCESKGKDVGKKMPITDANRVLFFKLSNVKEGIVYILHWKRIYQYK